KRIHRRLIRFFNLGIPLPVIVKTWFFAFESVIELLLDFARNANGPLLFRIPVSHIEVGFTRFSDSAVRLVQLKHWADIVSSTWLGRLQRAVAAQIQHCSEPFRAVSLKVLFKEIYRYVV